MHACLLSMACFSWFDTTQDNLPKIGIIHSGLGTPTISSQDFAPQTWPQTNLMETNPQ